MSAEAEVILFAPQYQERVWGGRELERKYSRTFGANATTPIGESWELVDREEAQSVVAGGKWAGRTLNALWTQERETVFGKAYLGFVEEGTEKGRFPLLFKILDAREKLSVQVHPPQEVAKQSGGEPKTEMWYFLDCDEGAEIYAGLRAGVDEATFREALQNGSVENCLHVLPAKVNRAIFIPSGRVHAIGGGNIIYEVQQNSDTTYRVFDWNRVGLDGVPRELHIEESLKSIHFEDTEPVLTGDDEGVEVSCPYFRLWSERWVGREPLKWAADGRFKIGFVAQGNLVFGETHIPEGTTFLVPACLENVVLCGTEDLSTVLWVELPVKNG